MSVEFMGMLGAGGIAVHPQTVPPVAKIVIEGDSQTAASGVLGTSSLSSLIDVRVNSIHQLAIIGTGGARIVETMLPRAASSFDPLQSNSVDLNIALLWGGANDIANGRSGTSTWNDGAKVWAQGRLAAGWDWVVLVNCLPREASSFEAEKVIYNNLMASEYAGLGNVLYADVAGNPADPGNQLGYYSSPTVNAPHDRIIYVDSVHVDDVGKGMVADIIVDALNPIRVY